MNIADAIPSPLNRSSQRTSMPGQAAAPAHDTGEYTCGAAGGACTCVDGASSSQFVYVWGDVDIRFPDPSVMVELETMAVTLNIHKAGPDESPRNWYLRVLQQPEARYIAREVSWILKVQGQPAYYLCLRDLSDLDNLIECLGSPEEYGYNYFNDLRVFVGRSLLVPIETCPGICAPVLLVNQLFAFSAKSMYGHIKNAVEEKDRRTLAEHDFNKLFSILDQGSDNFGDTDARRAINYLIVRYAPLYEEYFKHVVDKEYYLVGVTVARSRLSRQAVGKHIVDVIFSYQNQVTSVLQKWFVRVDVSHLFPMIVTHYQSYIDYDLDINSDVPCIAR